MKTPPFTTSPTTPTPSTSPSYPSIQAIQTIQTIQTIQNKKSHEKTEEQKGDKWTVLASITETFTGMVSNFFWLGLTLDMFFHAFDSNWTLDKSPAQLNQNAV